MSETYKEYVGRYRILRHEELPEEHKAAYRLNGIDPDTNWSLIWSFDNPDDAKVQFEICDGHKASWETYKLVDAGMAEEIERPAWF